MDFLNLIVLFGINSGLLFFFALIGHLLLSVMKINNSEKNTKTIGVEIILVFFITIID